MTARVGALRVTVVGACVLLALTLSCASDPVLLATDGEYYPFNFVNDAGEIDGLERELGDELCRRANLACSWVINDWDTLIPNLRANDFDAIIAGMSITAERDEQIDFTAPYYPPSPSVYLAVAGSGDAAAQGAVGTLANTIHSDYLTESSIPFTAFSGPQDAMDALLQGEVDAILVDHAFAMEKLAAHRGQLAVVGPSVELDRGTGIGVREDSGLKSTFDAGIAAMKEDGSLNTLILKWAGDDAATF